MENPDLVLQEIISSPTHSRLNYVPSGDTLRRDALSSFFYEFVKKNLCIKIHEIMQIKVLNLEHFVKICYSVTFL